MGLAPSFLSEATCFLDVTSATTFWRMQDFGRIATQFITPLPACLTGVPVLRLHVNTLSGLEGIRVSSGNS